MNASDYENRKNIIAQNDNMFKEDSTKKSQIRKAQYEAF